MSSGPIISGARLSLFPHVPIEVYGGSLYDVEGRTGVFSQWTAPPGTASVGIAGSNVGVGTLEPASLLDVRGDVNYGGTLLSNGAPVIFGCNIAIAASNQAFVAGLLSNVVVGWDPRVGHADATLLATSIGETWPSGTAVASWPSPSNTVGCLPAGRVLPRFAAEAGIWDGPYVSLPSSEATKCALVVDPLQTAWRASGGFTLLMGARIRDWRDPGERGSWSAMSVLSFYLRHGADINTDVLFHFHLERLDASTALTTVTLINDMVQDLDFDEPLFASGDTSWTTLGITLRRAEPSLVVCKNGRVVHASGDASTFEHFMGTYVDGSTVDGLCINGIARDVEVLARQAVDPPDSIWMSGPLDVAGFQVLAAPLGPAELEQALLDFATPRLGPAFLQQGGRRLVAPAAALHTLRVEGDSILEQRCTLSNVLIASSNIVVLPAGRLGVGTAEPEAALTVLINSEHHQPATPVAILTDGDVAQLSDARLAANVLRIDDALDRVARIGGYTFSRTDLRLPDGRRSAGVLAQELLDALPEAVSEDADGRLSVAYGSVAALVVEAVRELSGENAALRQRVASLEAPPSAHEVSSFALWQSTSPGFEPSRVGQLLTVPETTSVSSSVPLYSMNLMDGFAVDLDLARRLTWPSRADGAYASASVLRAALQAGDGSQSLGFFVGLAALEDNRAHWLAGVDATDAATGRYRRSHACSPMHASLDALLDESEGSWRFEFVPSPTSIQVLASRNGRAQWSAVFENSLHAQADRVAHSRELILNDDRRLGMAVRLPSRVSALASPPPSFPPAAYPLVLTPPPAGADRTTMGSVGRFTSFSLAKPTYRSGSPSVNYVRLSPASSLSAVDLALPAVRGVDATLTARFGSPLAPASDSFPPCFLALHVGRHTYLSVVLWPSGGVTARLDSGIDDLSTYEHWEVTAPPATVAALTAHVIRLRLTRDPDTGHASYALEVDGVGAASPLISSAATMERLGPGPGVSLRGVHLNKSVWNGGDVLDMDVFSLTVTPET
jgi:hypothetical protein